MLYQLHGYVIPAAYALLPHAMASDRATAMLLAIALQESECANRRQVRGPARSFWQFETGGILGILRHRASAAHVRAVLEALCYPKSLTAAEILATIEDNDVLACCCARLLLWTLPDALPGPDEADAAYRQYLSAWQPGKPRPKEWPGNYSAAWDLVTSQEG